MPRIHIIDSEKVKGWYRKHSSFINLIGLMLTVIVQSSSITTSLMVPMAGAGILALEQIFPYTVGADIGTTITAILAGLVTGNLSAIVVAFFQNIWLVFFRVDLYN